MIIYRKQSINIYIFFFLCKAVPKSAPRTGNGQDVPMGIAGGAHPAIPVAADWVAPKITFRTAKKKLYN